MTYIHGMSRRELRELAMAIGRNVRQFNRWVERGYVPYRWRLPLLREAIKRGKELLDSDFIIEPASSQGNAVQGAARPARHMNRPLLPESRGNAVDHHQVANAGAARTAVTPNRACSLHRGVPEKRGHSFLPMAGGFQWPGKKQR